MNMFIVWASTIILYMNRVENGLKNQIKLRLILFKFEWKGEHEDI